MSIILKDFIIGKIYSHLIDRLFGTNKIRRDFIYDREIGHEPKMAHNMIGQLILEGFPKMVCRYGFTEARLLGQYFVKNSLGYKREYFINADCLYATAGFFSAHGGVNYSDIDRFCESLIDVSEKIDLLGVNYAFMENYIVNKICKNAILTDFDNLGVLQSDTPWTQSLINKKVLIVHPFADTIEKQYEKRHLVWGNRCEHIMPDFDLKTYKAIQTIAGNNIERYKDWFEALSIMESDIASIDFDVAIIGCGAYGIFLAERIKRIGKIAIHLGGQTQILFGILGKRYESNPFYEPYINQHWVHPSKDETPSNFMEVEGGCYW